jgi:hypothetical protein
VPNKLIFYLVVDPPPRLYMSIVRERNITDIRASKPRLLLPMKRIIEIYVQAKRWSLPMKLN